MPRKGKLPPDPEKQNGERAQWADTAIESFMAATGTDREDALKDLLSDLMHWTDRNEFDFDSELLKARAYYADETARTGKQCWEGTRGAAILAKGTGN